MEIVKNNNFFESLDLILDYIFQDSVNRWLKFNNDLDEKIYNLDFMPYSHRQSIFFDIDNVRDLIFKWYVIPFKIDEDKKKIIILDIINYKNK